MARSPQVHVDGMGTQVGVCNVSEPLQLQEVLPRVLLQGRIPGRGPGET